MNRFLAIALCLAAVGSAAAQKANVDQAAKLSGKTSELNNARNLIKQAMENADTKNDAKTYYTAGKIEFDAYDNAIKTQMIKPDDPSAKPAVMADELVNGYKYFLQALPYDSLPNAKGQVKPQYTDKIYNAIAGHANDFFTAGANYFNEKMYYPQAFEAFMIYGDLPASGMLGKMASVIPADQVATAYFNAGLAAYQGSNVEAAANAFKKARLNNYDQPEAYIYEIACWQNVANNDTVRMNEAQANIMDVAKAGHEKYGLAQPIFLNNMINSLVIDNKTGEALSILDNVITQNPDSAQLYGLRGYVYDRADKSDESEADYRKAASFPNVDIETLKNAAKKVFRVGTIKWDSIEGASAEAAAARRDVKTNYFDVAKQITDRAKAIDPSDPDVARLEDSINYVLETYFNN